MFGSPYRMSSSGQLALPDVREWSAVPSGCPGVVGRPIRIFGSGRKTLQHVQKWSGGPPKCPGVFGRPSLMSLSGRKPFWMFGSCREALRISGRPSWLSGSDWETLPNVREALPDVQKNWKMPSDVRECSRGYPGC